MKRLIAFLLAIFALAGGAAWFSEHRVRMKLEEELHSLHLHLAAIQEDLAKARDRLNLRDSEVKHLRNTTREIFQLRNQAGMIQDKEKKIEELLGEVQHLRETGIFRGMPATGSSPADIEQNLSSKENWSFAGYGTPEAALQSFGWAIRDGDRQKILDAMLPEAKKEQEEEWAKNPKPPDEIKSDLQDMVKDVTGVKILQKEVISENEVTLAIYVSGEGDVEKYPLKRIGNEWKVGDSKTIVNLFKK